jgi:hypothetical protein
MKERPITRYDDLTVFQKIGHSFEHFIVHNFAGMIAIIFILAGLFLPLLAHLKQKHQKHLENQYLERKAALKAQRTNIVSSPKQ